MIDADYIYFSGILVAFACACIAAWRPLFAVATAIVLWLSVGPATAHTDMYLVCVVLYVADCIIPFLYSSYSHSAGIGFNIPVVCGAIAAGMLVPEYDWWVKLCLASAIGEVAVAVSLPTLRNAHTWASERVSHHSRVMAQTFIAGILSVMTILFPVLTVLCMVAVAISGRVSRAGTAD